MVDHVDPTYPSQLARAVTLRIRLNLRERYRATVRTFSYHPPLHHTPVRHAEANTLTGPHHAPASSLALHIVAWTCPKAGSLSAAERDNVRHVVPMQMCKDAGFAPCRPVPCRPVPSRAAVIDVLCYVRRAVPCRAAPCRDCRAVSGRAVSGRVVPCRAVSCRAVSCHVMPCRAVPRAACRAAPCRVVVFPCAFASHTTNTTTSPWPSSTQSALASCQRRRPSTYVRTYQIYEG